MRREAVNMRQSTHPSTQDLEDKIISKTHLRSTLTGQHTSLRHDDGRLDDENGTAPVDPQPSYVDDSRRDESNYWLVSVPSTRHHELIRYTSTGHHVTHTPKEYERNTRRGT